MSTPKNTPITKSKLRIGLSRTSGSIKKKSTILTPSCSGASIANNSTTTPVVSSKASTSRTVITKKKLEFAAQKQIESEIISDVVDEQLDDLDLESLKKLVEQKREVLRRLESHKTEKKELENVIEQWKEAGLEGIERLKVMKDPQLTDKEIYKAFKIPYDMFD